MLTCFSKILNLGKGCVPITGLAAADPATGVTVTIGFVGVACFLGGRPSSPATNLRFFSDMTKRFTGRSREVKECTLRLHKGRWDAKSQFHQMPQNYFVRCAGVSAKNTNLTSCFVSVHRGLCAHAKYTRPAKSRSQKALTTKGYCYSACGDHSIGTGNVQDVGKMFHCNCYLVPWF
jgi:hypothetical protein